MRYPTSSSVTIAPAAEREADLAHDAHVATPPPPTHTQQIVGCVTDFTNVGLQVLQQVLFYSLLILKQKPVLWATGVIRG